MGNGEHMMLPDVIFMLHEDLDVVVKSEDRDANQREEQNEAYEARLRKQEFKRRRK